MSSAMFPREFDDFEQFRQKYGPVDKLGTRVFLVGPNVAYNGQFRFFSTGYEPPVPAFTHYMSFITAIMGFLVIFLALATLDYMRFDSLRDSFETLKENFEGLKDGINTNIFELKYSQKELSGEMKNLQSIMIELKKESHN